MVGRSTYMPQAQRQTRKHKDRHTHDLLESKSWGKEILWSHQTRHKLNTWTAHFTINVHEGGVGEGLFIILFANNKMLVSEEIQSVTRLTDNMMNFTPYD